MAPFDVPASYHDAHPKIGTRARSIGSRQRKVA